MKKLLSTIVALLLSVSLSNADAETSNEEYIDLHPLIQSAADWYSCVLLDKTVQITHWAEACDGRDNVVPLVQYNGDWAYLVQEDQTITIVRYIGDGTESKIVIPPSIEGKPVTAIGLFAFEAMRSFGAPVHYRVPANDIEYHIVVPKTVVTVGDSAFSCIDNLVSVEFEGNVQHIDECAFFQCSKLSSVIFNSLNEPYDANSVLREEDRIVGTQAFSMCKQLQNIILPEGIYGIETGAFSGCDKLTEVVLPDGLKSIKSGNFYTCNSLNSLRVPASVSFIDAHFKYHDLEIIVEMDSYAERFCIENNVPYSYASTTELDWLTD